MGTEMELSEPVLSYGPRQSSMDVQNAFSAIALIQGGPGTGKTYFAHETVKVYLSSPKHLQVVHYSPDNRQVNDFARKCHNLLTAMLPKAEPEEVKPEL